MIWITRSSSPNYFLVRIKSDKFYVILRIIKDQENSRWFPKERCWGIGNNCFRIFLDSLKKEHVEDSIIFSASVYNDAEKLYYRNKILTQIKKISNKSKVVISQYNDLIPTENKLLPFQTIGAHFLQLGGRVLLADVVGLGKTPQSILAAETLLHQKKAHNVIIVCPNSLKRKWRDDIYKFLGKKRKVYIIEGDKKERIRLYRRVIMEKNAFIITHYETSYRDWEFYLFPHMENINYKVDRVLILDEAQYCVPYCTEIITDKGIINIGEIVENNLDVKVLSYNIGKNLLEYKTIVSKFRNELYTDLIKIKYKYGEIICTANHKIYTKKGYINASRISINSELRIVRNNIFSLPKPTQKSMLFRTWTYPYRNKIRNKEDWEEKTRYEIIDGNPESNEKSKNKRKSEKEIKRQTFSNSSWRKWKDTKATNDFISRIKKIWIQLGIRIFCKNNFFKKFNKKIIKLLQNRHCLSRKKNCSRSRWLFSQYYKRKTFRSEKEFNVEYVRVESIEILKQENYREYFSSCERNYVYNLEIEDNNNYFANNVLISNCKNSTTKRSLLAKDLANKCKYVFALSATFIETSFMDIFNVMLIVNKDVLGDSPGKFFNRHVKTDFFGRITGYKNTGQVIQLLDPVKIRRQKEEVFDQLPERLESAYWCKLTSVQEKCYREVLNNIGKNIQDKIRRKKVTIATILSQIQYLIQCCLSTELLRYEKNSSAKIDLLLELISQQFSNDKIVIFCFYTEMLEILKREMIRAGYKEKEIVVAHGNNEAKNKAKRHEIVTEFNNPNGRIKYLLTSNILKEGVDLVGSNILIHYDIMWNPATMEQRTGRIDRIGQLKDKINILYLITEETIEQAMWERITGRKKLIKDVVDEGFNSSRIKLVELLSMLGIKYDN